MNLRRLNLGAMLNCIDIEQTRSINGAAQTLNLSQPALSRSVRSLEDALGVPLFRRASTGVEPTPFGDTLLYHTRLIQSELLRCIQDIEERKNSGRASIQVGGTPGVIGRLLTPAVLEMLKGDEEINIGLVEAMPDDLHLRLLRGAIDLFVSNRLDRESDESIVDTPLMSDPMGIIVGPHHPLLRRKRVTMAQLGGMRWVLPARAADWQKRFADEFAAAAIPHPARIFSTNSFLALRQMLIETDAVALLPMDYVAVDLRARTLRRLEVAHRFAATEYHVYVRRTDTIPPLVARFRERLLDIADRLPGTLPTD